MPGELRGRFNSQEIWDSLHARPGFPPLYPSEAVVRFGLRHFGHGQPRRVVLDLGCGGGRHSAFFASLGHRVVALDYSIEGCRLARTLLDGRGAEAVVSCSAMQALCLADASIDGAIVYGVLYYTDASGYRAAVDELWRVLKPGAHALVRTRSTNDRRFGRGARVDERSFVMPNDVRDEAGMVIHFVDRPAIAGLFGSFREMVVDRFEETFDGETRSNTDWLIELVK